MDLRPDYGGSDGLFFCFAMCPPRPRFVLFKLPPPRLYPPPMFNSYDGCSLKVFFPRQVSRPFLGALSTNSFEFSPFQRTVGSQNTYSLTVFWGHRLTPHVPLNGPRTPAIFLLQFLTKSVPCGWPLSLSSPSHLIRSPHPPPLCGAPRQSFFSTPLGLLTENGFT